MKKVIVISSLFCLTIFSMVFYSCNKNSEIKSNSGNLEKKTRKAKWKVKFTWSGISGLYPDPNDNPCKGSPCGKCLGFCIYSQPTVTNHITAAERAENYGLADYSLVDEQLELSPDTYFDNGGGTVNITEDFNVGSEASHSLGFSNLIIKQGVYTIDYSVNIHGKVLFNIETN
jgi:hypothetical protein